VSFVERSKTCECNHNWAGELAPRHVSKPNQQWWINVILLCISSYSLSIYSPAMHSFKYPSFAAPQISFHPSLYVPLVCRLFNHLILSIAAAELFPPLLYRFCTCQIRRCRHTNRPTWTGHLSMTWRTNRARISDINILKP